LRNYLAEERSATTAMLEAMPYLHMKKRYFTSAAAVSVADDIRDLG